MDLKLNADGKVVFDSLRGIPTYTEGDELPEIIATLKNVDLTGYTIELRVERPSGTPLELAATAIDLAGGQFKFVFGSGDLEQGAGQRSYIRFVNASMQPLSSPDFVINVKAKIGS